MTKIDCTLVIAKWILVVVGMIFLISGTVVTVFYLSGVIPSSYTWQGPMFLALGISGSLLAWFGLRRIRIWPVAVLALIYIPWTILGLIGDSRQGFWPLVVGETIGLIAVLWALTVVIRKTI